MDERPPIERVRYVHNEDRKIDLYEVDAYRERTYEQQQAALAELKASSRLKAAEIAFQVYKNDPAMFDLGDVLRLADHLARFASDGNPVQDGTSNFRFYGRK